MTSRASTHASYSIYPCSRVLGTRNTHSSLNVHIMLESMAQRTVRSHTESNSVQFQPTATLLPQLTHEASLRPLCALSAASCFYALNTSRFFADVGRGWAGWAGPPGSAAAGISVRWPSRLLPRHSQLTAEPTIGTCRSLDTTFGTSLRWFASMKYASEKKAALSNRRSSSVALPLSHC